MPVASDRPPFASIVCLHHGPVDRRYAQAVIGRTDVPLDVTAENREARAIEAVLRFRPVRVVSSDRKRCETTAAKIAAAANVSHGARRDLRDRDYGSFEARLWPELIAAEPARAAAFLNAFASAAPPDGEALPAVAARLIRGLTIEARRHHRQVVAWVADAAPIRCLIAHALGAPLETVQRLKLDPFGLTVVRLQADASSVALLNAPADGASLEHVVW
jgi:ribonuclease H / adenosylcobalamin/alpha-ribazole phosphatase